MKRILILIPIAILFCSCNKATVEDSTAAEDSEKAVGAVRDSVALRLQPRDFTLAQLKDKASLTMENNSKEAIITGDNYHIERLHEGRWEMLEAFRELAFNSIGYMIPAGAAKEFEIGFLADKHRYTPGRYRVVKHYMKDADLTPKASQDVYFEFTVAP